MLQRLGWDTDAQDLFGAPRIRLLIGADAHTTMFSASHYLVLCYARATRVAAGGDGVIDAAAFEQVLQRCHDGLIVSLQAGSAEG